MPECSALVTKAEFDAYKSLVSQEIKDIKKDIKKIKEDLSKKYGKGQEPEIVEAGLNAPAVIAIIVGLILFNTKEIIELFKNSFDAQVKKLEKDFKSADKTVADNAEKGRKKLKVDIDEISNAMKDVAKLDKLKKLEDAFNNSFTEEQRKNLEFRRKIEREYSTKVEVNGVKTKVETDVKNTNTKVDNLKTDTDVKFKGVNAQLKNFANKVAEFPGIKQLIAVLDSKLGRLVLSVLTIFDIIGTLASLASVAALSEQMKIMNKEVDEAWSVANKAFLESGNAKSQARIATEKANSAITKSNQAALTADRATGEARDAIFKANGAIVTAENAINKAIEAYEESQDAIALSLDFKHQVQLLKSELAKIQSNLLDIAATQSLQSTQLKKALYQIAVLETLTASLEGEIEGLEDRKADIAALENLKGLIGGIGSTAQQALELAKQAIQLAAYNKGGADTARLQSQVTQLSNTFNVQLNSVNAQVTQLGSQLGQVQQQQQSGNLSATQVQNITNNITNSVTNNVTNNATTTNQITNNVANQITNNPTFNSYITKQITDKAVTPADFQKLEISLPDKIAGFVIPGLVLALTPKLDGIKGDTTAIKNTPAKNCLAPVYVPPVSAKVDRSIAATNTLQGYTAVQTTAIKADTTAINAQVIDVNVKTTKVQAISQSILNRANQISESVTKLWKTLGIDRYLNMMNTALLWHNAFMLSNNLGQTAISAVENIFQLFGLKLYDDKGSEIDLSSLVGKTVENIAKGALGVENYGSMTTVWKKASRIYQASINVLNSVQNIANAIQNLTVMALENIGQIGNALLKAGQVLQGAYPPMIENVSVGTPIQNALNKYNNTIQGADNAFSNIDQVTGELHTVKDSKTELLGDGTADNKGQIAELKEAAKAMSDAKKTENDASKTASASPAINNSDLVKPEN